MTESYENKKKSVDEDRKEIEQKKRERAQCELSPIILTWSYPSRVFNHILLNVVSTKPSTIIL